MSVQSNWRWYNKCQGLFYGSGVMNSQCPAGGTHSPAWLSDSGNYSLLHNVPADPSRQNDWRWCNKCQGLFYGSGVMNSQCPAGGTHSPAWQSLSGDYSIVHNGSLGTSSENDWRWCNKCQILFFGKNTAISRCPAGGTHSPASQSGSSDYVLELIKSSTIDWPWAIILCRFNDILTIPQPRDYFVDLFTWNGTGGMCDYWRVVSCNTLDLTRSEVFGWFTMGHSTSELSQLNFPGDRSKLVQWGIDAASANGVNLTPFKTVLVVQNYGQEHGAATNGIVIIQKNSTLCEFGFICHEMGHGFELPHSYSANPDMGYGDGWDLMSFPTTTFQFSINFRGTQGEATVGLNARNLEALNAIPVRRAWWKSDPDFSDRITLDPLNQTPIGNHGFLIAKITPEATQPPRPNGSSYTVEFRRKSGWDQNISQDAVLIHEIRSNGYSYLQPGKGEQFIGGQQFVTPDPKVFVKIVSIDHILGIAKIRIWDLPDGSLRKEDSLPGAYLIENKIKRLITSTKALTSLGKSWADVKMVPIGALLNIPRGPDVV